MNETRNGTGAGMGTGEPAGGRVRDEREPDEALVSVEDAWKSYDGGRVPVLRGVSVRVRAGEMVALWGASGSGKSTLLHVMGGLDVADRGRVRVCGKDPRDEVARLALRRRELGFVFQLHNLIPDLNVEENVRIPALAAGRPAAETAQRVGALIERLGLGHRRRHRIQDLSGGERQRVAICRALCNGPRVLLADEPTGSLDERTGEVVFHLLRDLTRQEGIALVIATHERRFAEACDRMLHVRDGRVGD